MSSRTRKIMALAQTQDYRDSNSTNYSDDKGECTVSSSDSSVLEISENLRDVIEGIQVDSPIGNFTLIQ